MSQVMLAVTDREPSAFGGFTTHFMTLSSGNLSLKFCHLSVSVSSFELLRITASGSDGGVYSELIVTGRDAMGTMCCSTRSIPLKNMQMKNIPTTSGRVR